MASKCGLRVACKQGEEFNLGFTIKCNDSPMDLSTYTVKVQVKNIPSEFDKPIIDKEITTTSDINEVGIIDDPLNGRFILHLTPEDTKYPIGEYYLVISINSDYYSNIISSGNCGTAQFFICEQ